MRFPILFMFALMPLLLIEQAWADVYKFVDGSGHVVYTDKPRHGGFKLIIRTPPSVLLARRSLAPQRLGFSRASDRNRRQYGPLIDATANKYSLDPALLHAVIEPNRPITRKRCPTRGLPG